MVDLIIQLGYVESTRFHVFHFTYTGPLAATRPAVRKNMPAIIEQLAATIQAYWRKFEGTTDDGNPSDFFADLVKSDCDSFGVGAYDFFEAAGWHLLGHLDKSEPFTVVNVANFMDDESDYLAWYGSTGKEYDNREG